MWGDLSKIRNACVVVRSCMGDNQNKKRPRDEEDIDGMHIII